MHTPTNLVDSSSPREKYSHPTVSTHNWLHSSNVNGSSPTSVFSVRNNLSSPHFLSTPTLIGLGPEMNDKSFDGGESEGGESEGNDEG
mmetsp:Transcript_8907/g.19228  ORF Transcript_8907/g.19228 Transcript_8907/m.19228 type:complete len:88 (+) Transcript_8907:1079-1342(+)